MLLAALETMSSSAGLGADAPQLAASLATMVKAADGEFLSALMASGRAAELTAAEPLAENAPSVSALEPAGSSELGKTTTAELGKVTSLARTNSLSTDVVKKDLELLRQAELYDEPIVQLFLTLFTELLASGTEPPCELAGAVIDFYARVVARLDPRKMKALPDWKALLTQIVQGSSAGGQPRTVSLADGRIYSAMADEPPAVADVEPPVISSWIMDEWARQPLWQAMVTRGPSSVALAPFLG